MGAAQQTIVDEQASALFAELLQHLERGRDLAVDLELSSDEARNGARRTVEYVRHSTCAACAGTGRDAASPPCDGCGGARHVIEERGHEQPHVRACPLCSGRGHEQRFDCPSCDLGRVADVERVEVLVPEGSVDGARLKIDGKGDVEKVPGDLYVTLVVDMALRGDAGSPYRGPRADDARPQEGPPDPATDVAADGVAWLLRLLIAAALVGVAVAWLSS